MALVISVFEQGFIYAVMALGIYITYKILDFPDLTVDGSFPMGAAIAAIMITKGIPAIITLPVAFLAGGLAGLITGLIHVKLHVRDLLSGIIVMTALYSVNLWIMGKANIPLYNNETIFDNGIVNSIFVGPLADFATSIILLVIVLVVKLILDWYLRTKSGFMLRAVGSNARLVTSMGINKGKIKKIGRASCRERV